MLNSLIHSQAAKCLVNTMQSVPNLVFPSQCVTTVHPLFPPFTFYKPLHSSAYLLVYFGNWAFIQESALYNLRFLSIKVIQESSKENARVEINCVHILQYEYWIKKCLMARNVFSVLWFWKFNLQIHWNELVTMNGLFLSDNSV